MSLHSEEDISPRRLAAVPRTAFCIRWREVADRNQAGDGSESLDERLVNAA
jgi:RNA polymerase-binding transcription factor DksA